MRLGDLLNHIHDNNIKNREFESDDKCFVVISNHSGAARVKSIQYTAYLHVNKECRFTIQVEEELTEKTVLKELVILSEDKFRGTSIAWNCSIEDLEDDQKKQKVYIPIDNELVPIWTKDHGILVGGVIEL